MPCALPWPVTTPCSVKPLTTVAALLPGEDNTGIVARADTALCQSKREDRNRVTCQVFLS